MLKINWNEDKITYLVLRIILVVFTIFFYKVVMSWDDTVSSIYKYLDLFSPFLLGFLFAFLINPGVMHIENILAKVYSGTKLKSEVKIKRQKKRIRTMSILAMYTIVLTTILITMRYIIPQLYDSVLRLFQNFPNNVMEDLPKSLSSFAEPFLSDETGKLVEYIEKYIPSVMETLKSLLSYSVPQILNTSISITSNIFDLVMAIIISVYLIADKERFIIISKKIVYALLKRPRAEKLLEVGRESNIIFKRFFVGKSLDSLIIGILCFILMNLFGFDDFPLLISVIIGITNMIPYFGPIIGAVPGFFIILFINPIRAFWFLLFVLALQQFDGIILGPKILGDSVGLRPIWIIFAIIIGGGLFGFLGMLLGVPTFTVLYNITKRFINRKLEQKNITQTDIKNI